MAKRRALVFDQDELTQNLKTSIGQGVAALFPPPAAPSSPVGKAQPSASPEKVSKEQTAKPVSRHEGEREGGSPPPAVVSESHDGSPIATATPRHRDTASRSPGSARRSTVRRIRKAVRQVGKEAATHRFTAEEKARLMDIVYTYARRGYRSSENELVRIGVNWLLDDYEEKGERSVLHIVMRALKE